jgi:hypothetical protein
MRRLADRLLLLACMTLAPTVAFAQASLAGLVQDTSGGVLPGVTVEAASPALIEKARTTTTDANGRYSIPDLRPGAYTITFTLSGFSTYYGDDGPAASATLNAPQAVAVATDGTVFIADTDNRRIRRIDPKGTITTIAGRTSAGVDGDGGPALRAHFSDIVGLAVGARGRVYLIDSTYPPLEDRIRVLVPEP